MARVYLNLQQPATEVVARRIIDRHRHNGWVDLSQAYVAVPGSRGGRRLLQRLIEICQSEQLRFFPPRILTPGQLPGVLISSGESPPTWQLDMYWAEAFDRLRPEDQIAVLGRSTHPGSEGVLSRIQVVLRIPRVRARYEEITSEGLRFADVARAAVVDPPDASQHTWQLLAQLESHYLNILRKAGWRDPQDEGLEAIANKTASLDRPLYLACIPDLNRLTRLLLEQVRDRVTALIYATEDMGDRFDEFGCVDPPRWLQQTIQLPDEAWSVVQGPADAAERAASLVASRSPQMVRHDMTLGTADPQLVRFLRHAFERRGARVRWASGQPLASSSPYQLLVLIRDWLDSDRAQTLASLVRHPDIEAWLTRRGAPHDWLSQLDQYLIQHLPSQVGLASLLAPETNTAMEAVIRAADVLRAKFPREIRPLADWCRILAEVMAMIYAETQLHREAEPDRTARIALEQISQYLGEVQNLGGGPSLGCEPHEALDWLLGFLAAESIPAASDDTALELLGWLELLVDDAQELVLCGFNEGSLPSRTADDALLSPALRARLDLTLDPQRLARDAYTLWALLQSRRWLHLVAMRVGTNDEPLLPSRLLFLGDGAATVRRWQQFLAREAETARFPSRAAMESGDRRSQFSVPTPARPFPTWDQVRVTDFRGYLACPYRFYLGRVLKLESVSDASQEMDASSFGMVLHNVLAAFGRSDVRDSTEPEILRQWLHRTLDDVAHQRFGPQPRAAVQLQVEQMRLRLSAFAQLQAEHASIGWRIVQVEISPPNGVPWKVGKKEIRLTGRIDRIDRHEQDGQILILDYKTSDTGSTPEVAHQDSQKRWIDLQLPLYRILARPLGYTDEPQLGYFNLPRNEECAGPQIATWNRKDLASAETCARDVVRKLRRGIYTPMKDPPPKYSESWSYICMDGVRESD